MCSGGGWELNLGSHYRYFFGGLPVVVYLLVLTGWDVEISRLVYENPPNFPEVVLAVMNVVDFVLRIGDSCC